MTIVSRANGINGRLFERRPHLYRRSGLGVSRRIDCRGTVGLRRTIVVALLIITTGCATSSYRLFRSAESEVPPAAGNQTSAPIHDISPPSDVTQAALTTSADSLVTPAVHVEQPPEEIPALEATDYTYRLDMSTALALVAGQNPQVGYARWKIREAYANLEHAQALWLPSIQTGVSYHRNEGNLQDSTGAILDVSRSSLQAGLGAGAVGAGTTPQPGIVAQFQLVDAIYQPAIAQRSVWAQEHARDAALNDQLLEAAVAYQELLRAHQLWVVALQTAGGSQELVRLTTAYANAGQGTRADADRSLAELALRKNNVARSEEAVAVASARLAQVLSVRGINEIVPVEDTIVPIDLAAAGAPQDNLAMALANRPELKESHDLVAEACERLRRERYAPLMPSVLLGASYGGFGGGMGDTVADFNDRIDFDAMAIWQIRNLGYGEKAARQAASARLQQETMRQVRVMDTIAREVAEAEVRVRTRFGRIATAQSGVQFSRESFDHNFTRIREGQGLPIEVLQAIQSLDINQRELVDATADYNIAQFQFQRALGWPVQ